MKNDKQVVDVFMRNCSKYDAFLGHSFLLFPTETLKKSKHWVNPFPEDFLVDIYCWSTLREDNYDALKEVNERVKFFEFLSIHN